MKLQQLEIRNEKKKRFLEDACANLQALKEECRELKNTYNKQKQRLENLCKELSDKGWKRTWKSERSIGPYFENLEPKNDYQS